MSEIIYDVPTSWSKKAWATDAKYKKMYAASIKDPDKFWGEQGKRSSGTDRPRSSKITCAPNRGKKAGPKVDSTIG